MKTDASPRPQRKPAEQPKEKPAGEVEVEKPAAEAAPKPGETAAPKSPMRVLGEKYETLKKEVETTYKPTIQRLESQIKDLEKAAASPELAEQVHQWKARAESAEKKLEVEAFTKSPKYENEFEKPYVEAYHRAVSQLKALKVKEQTGETENPETGMKEPVYQYRLATESDLLKLSNMDVSEMDEAVSKLFGASAPRVLQHIEKLKELASARRNAAQTAEQSAEEARKQQAASAQERMKTIAGTWMEVNKSLEEKFPKAFKPLDGDTEDAAAHARGFALGDLTFVGERGLTPQQVEALPSAFRDTIKAGQPLTEAQRVQLHALARLKIANHDRLNARLKKANARIAALEKDLADFEKSEPGGRPGARTSPGGTGKDWLETAEDELRRWTNDGG